MFAGCPLWTRRHPPDRHVNTARITDRVDHAPAVLDRHERRVQRRGPPAGEVVDLVAQHNHEQEQEQEEEEHEHRETKREREMSYG